MTPRTELGRKLLHLREKARTKGYLMLTEEDIAMRDDVEAWRLEAERLAELVEALREENAEHKKTIEELEWKVEAESEARNE